MSDVRNVTASSVGGSAVPAGWYPDPHGLPQQRWWTGEQWTHAVAPPRQDPLRAPQVTAQPAPRETFALPATPTVHSDLPTRRQLREQAAREAAAQQPAEPHPAAPFVVQPTPAAPTGFAPAATIQPVVVTPTVAEPASAADIVASFPPPVASQQVLTPPYSSQQAPATAPVSATPVATPALAAPVQAAPAWTQQPAAAPVTPVANPWEGLATPSLTTPPPVATVPAQPVAASAPLAIAASTTPQSAWPFQTPQGAGFETPDIPYQPFGMKQSVKAGVAVAPDRVQTGSAWIIAILPLVMLGVGVAVITQLGEFYTTFMAGGLLFIFVLATVALAVRDRRALLAYGHTRTAHPAWVLLTPGVYLAIRSAYARGSAGRESAPLLAWLVSVAAIAAFALLMPELLPKFVPGSLF